MVCRGCSHGYSGDPVLLRADLLALWVFRTIDAQSDPEGFCPCCHQATGPSIQEADIRQRGLREAIFPGRGTAVD